MNAEGRIAIVLWSGALGGAETFSLALCRAFRRTAIDARLVFVGAPEPLVRGEDPAVPFASLGLSRGRDVIRHPRALAKTVEEVAPEAALLVSPGFLAAALRIGGYRGRVVAVNHGGLIHRERERWRTRVKRRVDEASGFWAADVEVAVSDIVLAALQRRMHARRLVRIYNAVDLERFRPARNGRGRGTFTIGWAGRLIPGKGLDDLIRSVAQLGRPNVELRIAGDGPLRKPLGELAAALGVAADVRFEGPQLDMAAFWQGCDLASVPSNQWIESFGMAAVEAMACGLPVVAAQNGALPEVVENGLSGLFHERGDVRSLTEALGLYAANEELMRAHAVRARQICETRFDVRDCASAYRALFDEPALAS